MKYAIPSVFLVLAALLAVPVAGLGQTIIENPAVPAACDSGRVRELAEVWRITDEGGQFSLKYPDGFQIAGDGSLFITDQNQILRFTSEGEFIKNVLRLGEGPGEVKAQRRGAPMEIFVRGFDLYIFDPGTHRCLRTDLDGRHGQDIGMPKTGWTIPVGIVREGILFWRMELPQVHSADDPITTGVFRDIAQTLTLQTWEPGTLKDIFTLTNRTFVSPRLTQPAHFIWALSPDGKSLYLFTGPEYLVQELDLASGAVIKRFRRPYERVPASKPEQPEGPSAKKFEEYRQKGWWPPEEPFLPDIQGLHVVGDQLWVSTSTRDKAKGSLIDVYDKDGRYVDCFYTGKNWGRPFEGFVLGGQRLEDGTLGIVKFRIVK